MATVINVKVASIRPAYNNLEEWCEDDNNVYIGRAGIVFIKNESDTSERYPKQSSVFCNPYKVTSKLSLEESLALYRTHLSYILEDVDILREFLSLRGKNLGCWCKPNACHGDIIVEELNKRC